ncbi:MAG: Flagellar M-ring protein [Desulfotomaculum sp. 46_296]|nr:MAG: Flagellar M-ring protein [Desulfotomaculum sp. 46_296]HAU32306.1 flagellar M-ring protein FliF [Desulfotomaculum sp.]
MNWANLPAEAGKNWQTLQPKRRMLIVAVGVGLIFCVFFIYVLLNHTTYAPLFTGLDPSEAGSMVEKLKEKNIPYRLSDQGKTILVPEKQVYETRIELASSGALGQGKGFEIFDQTKLGITDFEQQVQYQRALQEELRRTITQLDEVEQARVHLVLPAKSVFIEQESPSSASIVLKLKPMVVLKPNQIKGIVDLTVGSVEGLKPENVHVVDTNGNVLDVEEKSSIAGGMMEQYQVKTSYENALEKRIRTMLEKIFGQGKTVVMVTADLDFNKQEIQAETYQQGPIVSEQLIKENALSSEATGIPGTESNSQVNPQVNQVAQNGGTPRVETIRNYQPISRQEKIYPAVGNLQRLSIAVAVDAHLSQDIEQQITSVVSSATGLNQSRGDQLTISTLAFDKSSEQEAEAEMARQEAAQRKDQQQKFIFMGIAGLIGITVLLFLIKAILNRISQNRKMEIEELRPIEDMQVREIAVQPTVEDKIRYLAKQQPAEVAEIIKVWLAENQ